VHVLAVYGIAGMSKPDMREVVCPDFGGFLTFAGQSVGLTLAHEGGNEGFLGGLA